jgi:hypothetical protein
MHFSTKLAREKWKWVNPKTHTFQQKIGAREMGISYYATVLARFSAMGEPPHPGKILQHFRPN